MQEHSVHRSSLHRHIIISFHHFVTSSFVPSSHRRIAQSSHRRMTRRFAPSPHHRIVTSPSCIADRHVVIRRAVTCHIVTSSHHSLSRRIFTASHPHLPLGCVATSSRRIVVSSHHRSGASANRHSLHRHLAALPHFCITA